MYEYNFFKLYRLNCFSNRSILNEDRLSKRRCRNQVCISVRPPIRMSVMPLPKTHIQRLMTEARKMCPLLGGPRKTDFWALITLPNCKRQIIGRVFGFVFRSRLISLKGFSLIWKESKNRKKFDFHRSGMMKIFFSACEKISKAAYALQLNESEWSQTYIVLVWIMMMAALTRIFQMTDLTKSQLHDFQSRRLKCWRWCNDLYLALKRLFIICI